MKKVNRNLKINFIPESFMKKIGLLLGLCLLSINISVSQSKVGTTAAPFLGISVGPKAMGMGSAFVALANDATALYWNPSGLS